MFYQDKGYWPEAFYNYSKAIQINPNNFRAHHNRGNVCHNIGDYPQAIYNYDRSIELCPNDSKAHHNKGVALVALGENEEAKKNCKEWTTSAIEHHIKWTELCINQNIVDYTTSMFIYMLRHLLQKEKYNGLIPKINEQTAKYINTVIKYEHDENENEKEITECAIKTGDDKVILYKYSLYDDYAKDNIKNEQIYFSDPFKFNDSFDPLIRVLNDEHSEGLVKLLNFKVSCLSKKEDNLLLWSHYADKHQGICIAYDITDLVKKDNIVFRKIQYIEKFPKPQDGLILALSNMDDKTSKKETLIDTFTKKHTDWDYEDEYRLILHTDNENDFLRKAPIKEIYLGRDMLKEDKEFIKTMLGEMNAKKKPEEHIKLYSMGETDENIFQLVPTPEN